MFSIFRHILSLIFRSRVNREYRAGDGWIFTNRYGWRPTPAGGAGGETNTGALSDSLPSTIHGARQVREQQKGFVATVDTKRMPMGTGSSWQEIDLAKIDAQAVPESSKLDNPQKLSDTLISVEPTMVGVHLMLTPQVKHYVSANVGAQWGGLLQNSIQRKKDIDGLSLYDQATVTGGGTGTTLTGGEISAMVAQIMGDTDEAAPPDVAVHAHLHEFQIHDVRTELTAGVGTYEIPSGLTADAWQRGNRTVQEVGGAIIHRNGNITIDSTPDAHGGVHSRDGIVLVEVDFPKEFDDVLKNQGGAEVKWLYDWYGFVERSAGNWVKRLLSDATAPTS